MSQFRQDIVSGEWIISAPERAKRPHELGASKKVTEISPKEKCPFEDFSKSGNGPVLFHYPAGADWRVAVIPNKFPALARDEKCGVALKTGPYVFMEGAGRHELVIPRGHDKGFSDMDIEDVFLCLKAVQARFRELSKDKCIGYISCFHSWGASAGASIYHPHIQLLALPIVPPHVARSLEGSARYARKNESCPHCDMLKYESKAGTRVIHANRESICIAPYASEQPYEMKIFPAKHLSSFEGSSDAVLRAVAESLVDCLSKLRKNVDDPDFNFYIHTAPAKNARRYSSYHWHIEVLPKISIFGGFEWSTGIEVNVVDPDLAAKQLNG